MSCWDCLRIFFPSSYQFSQPNYELEELVIVNNNNTTETTYLKYDIAQTQLSHPTKTELISPSASDIEEILDDEDDIIFERKPKTKSPTRNNSSNYYFHNLSDTEVFGNQKLKKRRKKQRMIKPIPIKKEKSSIFSSTDTDESSWDDSLIIS